MPGSEIVQGVTEAAVFEVQQPNLAAGYMVVRWRWIAVGEGQKRSWFGVDLGDPGKRGVKAHRPRAIGRREPVVDFLEAGKPQFSLPVAPQAFGSRQGAADAFELIFPA